MLDLIIRKLNSSSDVRAKHYKLTEDQENLNLTLGSRMLTVSPSPEEDPPSYGVMVTNPFPIMEQAPVMLSPDVTLQYIDSFLNGEDLKSYRSTDGRPEYNPQATAESWKEFVLGAQRRETQERIDTVVSWLDPMPTGYRYEICEPEHTVRVVGPSSREMMIHFPNMLTPCYAGTRVADHVATHTKDGLKAYVTAFMSDEDAQR